jgi:hypothetical protein
MAFYLPILGVFRNNFNATLGNLIRLFNKY